MRFQWIQTIALINIVLLLSACSDQAIKDGPPPYPVDVSKIKNAAPRFVHTSRYGNPKSYTVDGKRYYVLKSAVGYNERGIASWYGTKFDGQLTSTRERYNMLAMTGASPVLPIPCYVRVTNLNNNRSVIVKINDRGPFAPNRILDLSYAAALKLGYARKGTALVQVTAIDTKNPNATPKFIPIKHPKLYLQVGAFSHFYNAKQLSNTLKKYTRKPIHIEVGILRNQPLYRVQVGPLPNVGESDRLQAKFENDGLGRALTVIG